MPSWHPPLGIGPLPIEPATADLLIAVFLLLAIIGLAMMIGALVGERRR